MRSQRGPTSCHSRPPSGDCFTPFLAVRAKKPRLPILRTSFASMGQWLKSPQLHTCDVSSLKERSRVKGVLTWRFAVWWRCGGVLDWRLLFPRWLPLLLRPGGWGQSRTRPGRAGRRAETSAISRLAAGQEPFMPPGPCASRRAGPQGVRTGSGSARRAGRSRPG